MPGLSKSQQQAAAIALHAPGKLFKRNLGFLKMDRGDLRDFAETKHKGLPKHKNSPDHPPKKFRVFS
ncbi:MAG TPA: DUF3008 domain-containing protein [Desulfobacterales bacterium]|nr:DUF3008 domain-containing protein [Desulfobacterales bacterium]